MLNSSKIMEAIWLVLSAGCLGIGIYSGLEVGFSKSYMFFLLSVAALLMFALRRFKRKHQEKNQPQ